MRLFSYDPGTGELRWRVDHGRKIKAGRLIACRTVKFIDQEHRTSRICWFIATGRWPEEIDHRDLNELNNKFKNLRECTHAQNIRNRTVTKRNKLGVKGVCRHQGGFRVSIRMDGVVRRKCFKSLDEAAATYRRWSAEIHGEFGRPN